jgi:hypothetical protein
VLDCAERYGVDLKTDTKKAIAEKIKTVVTKTRLSELQASDTARLGKLLQTAGVNSLEELGLPAGKLRPDGLEVPYTLYMRTRFGIAPYMWPTFTLDKHPLSGRAGMWLKNVNRVILLLRTGGHSLQQRMADVNWVGATAACPLCKSESKSEPETLTHFLLHCEKLSGERLAVSRTCEGSPSLHPAGTTAQAKRHMADMLNHLDRCSDDSKVQLILSAGAALPAKFASWRSACGLYARRLVWALHAHRCRAVFEKPSGQV